MRHDTWKRKWIASLLGGLTLTAGVRAGDDKPPPYPSISPVLPALKSNSANPPLPVTPEVKPVSGTSSDTPSIPTPVVPKLETPVVPKLDVPAVPKLETPVVPKLETPVVPKVDSIALPQVPSLPTTPAEKPQEKPVVPTITPVVPPTVTPSVTPPTVSTPAVIPSASVTPVTPTVTTPTIPQITETKPVATPSIPPTVTPSVTPVSSSPVTPSIVPGAGKIESTPSIPPVTEPTTPNTTATKPAQRSTVNISLGATPGVLDNTGKLDAMLSESKESYMKVHDYSCHFIKQERLKGKLTPEVIFELHARTVPFAVYTKAVQPKEFAGFESVYVAGRFATDQVRVKPSGGVYMTMASDDSRAMAGRHPANQVGIGAVLAMLEKQISMERKLGNPITVTISDFTYANKPVIRYELLCDKPHANRYSHRTVIYFDKETKLPVRIEAYDEPRSGGGVVGDLLESYSFVNIKLNVGHSSAVFDR